MIAHVAAAGESRGRVVLRLGAGEASPVALDAAIRVAQAFNSEIEALFVENQQLLQMARFPFAREISRTGRSSRSICPADMEQDLRLVCQAVQRRVEALARLGDVPIRHRVVRDGFIEAVARACAESGPWNVIALAEPFGPDAPQSLGELLSAVVDATGIVLVGPKAKRTHGPVVIALEDAGALAAMMHAAERMAPITGGEIVVLLIGQDDEQIWALEGQVRLSLAGRTDVRIVNAAAALGAEAVVAEALRRLQGGFVIARMGGLAVPRDENGDGDVRPLAAALECPLFLVR